MQNTYREYFVIAPHDRKLSLVDLTGLTEQEEFDVREIYIRAIPVLFMKDGKILRHPILKDHIVPLPTEDTPYDEHPIPEYK